MVDTVTHFMSRMISADVCTWQVWLLIFQKMHKVIPVITSPSGQMMSNLFYTALNHANSLKLHHKATFNKIKTEWILTPGYQIFSL